MTTANQLIYIMDNKIPEAHARFKEAIMDFNANPTDSSLREKALRSIRDYNELLNEANDIVVGPTPE